MAFCDAISQNEIRFYTWFSQIEELIKGRFSQNEEMTVGKTSQNEGIRRHFFHEMHESAPSYLLPELNRRELLLDRQTDPNPRK